MSFIVNAILQTVAGIILFSVFSDHVFGYVEPLPDRGKIMGFLIICLGIFAMSLLWKRCEGRRCVKPGPESLCDSNELDLVQEIAIGQQARCSIWTIHLPSQGPSGGLFELKLVLEKRDSVIDMQGSRVLQGTLEWTPTDGKFESLPVELGQALREAFKVDKESTLQVDSFSVYKCTEVGIKSWTIQEGWAPTILELSRSSRNLVDFLTGHRGEWVIKGLNLENAVFKAATRDLSETFSILHQDKTSSGVDVLTCREPPLFQSKVQMFQKKVYISAVNVVTTEGETLTIQSKAKNINREYWISVSDLLIPMNWTKSITTFYVLTLSILLHLTLRNNLILPAIAVYAIIAIPLAAYARSRLFPSSVTTVASPDVKSREDVIGKELELEGTTEGLIKEPTVQVGGEGIGMEPKVQAEGEVISKESEVEIEVEAVTKEQGVEAEKEVVEKEPKLQATAGPTNVRGEQMGPAVEARGEATVREADAAELVPFASESSKEKEIPLDSHQAKEDQTSNRLEASVQRDQLGQSTTLSASRPVASGSTGSTTNDQLQRAPYGLVAVRGRRREMEDVVISVPAFFSLSPDQDGAERNSRSSPRLNCFDFVGVYDGHGGSQVARYCADRLHHILVEEMTEVTKTSTPVLAAESLDLKWKETLTTCFLRMDAEVGGVPRKEGQHGRPEESGRRSSSESIAPETVGTTAVVAVVSSCDLIIANCGDSRAVLSRGGHAIALSRDHKPEREDEMARVEAAGGSVIYWNGYRVLGLLSMSRAIGDRYLKPYVIAEPEVTCTQRREEDECLILASDGLWDVASNEEVCELARKCLISRRRRSMSTPSKTAAAVAGPPKSAAAVAGPPKSVAAAAGPPKSAAAVAAARLTKLALDRGSNDNISVVVVDLMTGPERGGGGSRAHVLVREPIQGLPSDV